jgi:hypothetical protein
MPKLLMFSKPGHAFVLLSLLWLVACTTPIPATSLNQSVPIAAADMQVKTLDQVTVSVAILTDEQAREYFGVDIAARELQAIWLRIRNASPHHLWFIRNHLDRDVYSPDEVAEMMRDDIPDAQFEMFRQQLRNVAMRVSLMQNTITQGVVFVPKHEGGRYVDIRLTGDAYDAEANTRPSELKRLREYRFGFAVPLPDGDFDYERLDTQKIYADKTLPDLNAQAFRQAIEQLPCCAQDAEAEHNADPLNVVIVAEATDVLNSLTRSGWSFTHRISLKSVTRLIGATLQGEAYPVAPVSSLYVFNRKQDFALQRARRSIAQRNHMRFWLAPFTYQGQQVWVGQVSRDIGIKLTTRSPTLTTHVIDPQVDLAREYLLHSLLAEGFVKQFGFARGATQATRSQPAQNLTDDPYFSDGMRLVMILSPHPLPIDQVHSLQWERSDAPVAEGQTEEALNNQLPIGQQEQLVD